MYSNFPDGDSRHCNNLHEHTSCYERRVGFTRLYSSTPIKPSHTHTHARARRTFTFTRKRARLLKTIVKIMPFTYIMFNKKFKT